MEFNGRKVRPQRVIRKRLKLNPVMWKGHVFLSHEKGKGVLNRAPSAASTQLARILIEIFIKGIGVW